MMNIDEGQAKQPLPPVDGQYAVGIAPSDGIAGVGGGAVQTAADDAGRADDAAEGVAGGPVTDGAPAEPDIAARVAEFDAPVAADTDAPVADDDAAARATGTDDPTPASTAAADDEPAATATAPDAVDRPTADQLAATEAILFAAGDSVRWDQLCGWTGLSLSAQQAVVQALSRRMRQDTSCGLTLRVLEDKVCLTVKPDMKPWLTPMFEPKRLADLSPAAYEALAVIAYNQPVTRSQVEAVRGVNSDNVMARLLERGLIDVEGHLDAPGRPALFVTTERFLLETGLSSLDELQPMEMLMYDTLQDFEHHMPAAAEPTEDLGFGNDY